VNAEHINRVARGLFLSRGACPCRSGNEANADKVREQSRKWKAANVDKVREQKQRWRAANVDKERERRRKWRAANADKERERSRGRCQASNQKWRAANPERVRKIKAKWRKANSQTISIHRAIRKKRHREATPPWVDMAAIRAIYEERNRVSAETGIEHHVDHIVPLKGRTVCGLHVPWNLRVIPAVDNRAKGSKLVAIGAILSA
jgi:hypothetical protein